ncbi:hypothetical protein Tco_0789273 [Tanacetum coccineum]
MVLRGGGGKCWEIGSSSKDGESGHSEDEDGANLFVNVKKAIEANCRKGVAKIRFIFEKVEKDDTTFIEEASHERLVDLPFMFGEASGTVIHGNVVCGVAMINLNGIRHNVPKDDFNG